MKDEEEETKQSISYKVLGSAKVQDQEQFSYMFFKAEIGRRRRYKDFCREGIKKSSTVIPLRAEKPFYIEGR